MCQTQELPCPAPVSASLLFGRGDSLWWVCFGFSGGIRCTWVVLALGTRNAGTDLEVLSYSEHEAHAGGHRAWAQSPCPQGLEFFIQITS